MSTATAAAASVEAQHLQQWLSDTAYTHNDISTIR